MEAFWDAMTLDDGSEFYDYVHHDLAAALALQRKAQWRLDFVAAENSMGFHAPQEAARILGEAADYARQGQIAAIEWLVEAQKPTQKDKL